MGIFYKNRTLAGNICLVVFMAFLFSMTFGMYPGAAAAVTPTLDDNLQQQVTESAPVKVIDKASNWQGENATLRTSSDGKQVTLTVQVLTADSFDNILLNLVGIGQVNAQNVTSATYKVYSAVYSVYQLVYTWVYGSTLNVASSNDYTFEVVYNSNLPLKSITLDLENPPPNGGGGSSSPSTTTNTDTGTVTTTGSTASLVVEQTKLDSIIADPNTTKVELTVPDTGTVTNGEVSATVEQLDAVFAANKDVVVSYGEVELAFKPGAIDLTPFDGQNATVKFEVREVAEGQVSNTTGTTLKIAGKVYELNVRVLVDGVDKGGIHNFNKSVQVALPYDPAKLAGASEDSLGAYRLNETTNEWEFVGGTVDKTGKSVIVDLNHFSKYAVMAYQKTFTDLAGHWAKADVELMAARRVVTGMTDTTFGPDLNVTRAQFAALLQRSLGLTEESGAAGQFTDVQNGDWFFGAVEAAAKAGLVKGYDDGAFRPEQLITRQEMAVMVTRALTYSGKTTSLNASEVSTLLAGFSDAAEIGSWASEAAAIAVKLGIVQGRAADLYAPASNATRAEAVVMLKRMLAATGAL